MAKVIKKQFTNGQPVVFQFGDRNLVGKVVNWKLANKHYFYDVIGENGILYEDLPVDADYKLTINTYFTKLFYAKYQLSENAVPELEVVVEDDSIDFTDSVSDSSVDDDIEYTDELQKLADSYMYDEENPEFE